MRSVPTRAVVQRRLRQLAAIKSLEVLPNNLLTASAIVTMIYIDAVVPNEGEIPAGAVFARANTCLLMSDAALSHLSKVERIAWRDAATTSATSVASLLDSWGEQFKPWYAQNSRELLRTSVISPLIAHGAIRPRPLPTTSPLPRWALTTSFAEIFGPELEHHSTIEHFGRQPLESSQPSTPALTSTLDADGDLTFLCHSSGDRTQVRHLYRRLSEDGFNCWLDEENLIAGQTWDLEIRKAIKRATRIIVCLSHSSVNKTGYVQRELRLALDRAEEQPEGSIFIVPVRLEECNIPERLQHLHYVDAFAPDGHDRLVRALRLGS